jgi:glycosyltransferase involved in cell wall biosynthesis
VLVNASTSEGIPVSMMEAHCSGIPVIGPNVGGVGEIVRTGVNGILLEPPLSSDTLATAIQSIVEMRLEDYAALCVRARASWEERFSAAANYPAFVQAVAQLIPVSRTP